MLAEEVNLKKKKDFKGLNFLNPLLPDSFSGKMFISKK